MPLHIYKCNPNIIACDVKQPIKLKLKLNFGNSWNAYLFIGNRLNGKVAIVTGASSGIGEAIALALASEGAKVAMAARRLDRLQLHQARIEKEGGVAVSVKTDVTSREQVCSKLEAQGPCPGHRSIII